MGKPLDSAARLAALELENAKLRKINEALMRRVEQGLADNGNSFTFFQVAAELETRIQERTSALEQAMADLEASNFALKEAKHAAELARNQLNVAVETIADGFALWGSDNCLIHCNRKFTEMFPTLRQIIVPGLPFETLIRAAVDAHLIHDAEADPEGWIAMRLAYHREPQDSLILAMSDGSWHRVSERAIGDGGDGGRVAIYTDITEIKHQEMRLRERDLAAYSQLLHATMNSIRQGIAVFDSEGRLREWNPRFVELTQPSPAELGDANGLLLAEWARCCPLGGTMEYTNERGQTLEVQYNPMPGDGFVMSYTDISERKEAEQALRESEAKMRLITDAMPALIAYVDNQQIYRFTNKAYESWFGVPQSEINGRSMREVLGPRLFDGRRHYVERALSGKASVFELQLPAPRQHIEFARATFIPHFTGDGSVLGFFALIQDITESRRAAQELQQAKEQLEVRVAERTKELSVANGRLREAIRATEDAQQSKTRFFAAASHDLLQPLNAARLFLAALSGQDLPPAIRPLVEKTGTALESVDDLINTLLEISRLDAGAVEAAPRHFPVAQLLEQITEEFAPLAEAKSLRLQLHTCPAIIHSDWVLLGRVIRNFLSNAIRYTREGGILLGCRRQPDGLLIGVWDQGLGIPSDKLALVFQEFQRLPEHHSLCPKGMGLGLAIVSRLARRLDHRLVVRSRFGRGSLFGIVVPYGEVGAVGPSPQPDTPQLLPPPAQRRDATILLIDNEASILEGMCTLLSDWHYRPLAAASANEAIELLRREEIAPDAILADYHLDYGATGIDAIRAVYHYLGRSVPAALITADRSDEVRQEAEAGGWAWLGKPVRPARLRTLLAHLTQPVGE
ncbi:NahK/ErcS family hybrid sensor histidine kinase/response regulator [Pseudogulbenkiania sp. MAI-1]|uniref:PAS domain-containing hybrid sensor histidine kinase/response regulator n=1 Tax=Pseudogulbenkiania sp. MAI-1 TaxID=990370 RepID=UPI0004B19AAB|nr:NahK/ErcS family hybrid sensor histidine kinase/response regulator [Pseudogulbenkiania sp. MAI-1]